MFYISKTTKESFTKKFMQNYNKIVVKYNNSC